MTENKSHRHGETLAITALILTFVCIIAWVMFFVVPAQDRAEREEQRFIGACQNEGGHVYYIDQGHKVCIRDGKVVLR